MIPADCLELWRGVFDPNIFDPRIFQTDPVKVDWQRRQDSLYLNWDDARGQWHVPDIPEREIVEASITCMIAFLNALLTNGWP